MSVIFLSLLRRLHSVPVHTENSVRINPHPCGTLIADLVDALSSLASRSESKDWQSLPRSVVEYIQVQGIRVAKESGFGSTRVWLGRSRRSGISAYEGKRRDNRLAPAKRRVAGISDHGREVCSVDGISIAQYISRRFVPGKRFPHLLYGPLLCGMFRHPEMQHPASLMR